MFADLFAAAGRATDAARLWGASERLLESVGGQLPPSIGWVRQCYLEPMKISSPEGSFDAAWAEGRAMPIVHAVALTRQPTSLRG